MYRSPNTVRMVKFRRLRWADHVARLREDRGAIKILTDKRTGKRHLKGQTVDKRTILEKILKK